MPSARLAAECVEIGRPYFSICIPQYNRTEFLILACRSFASQTFRDFEICISDDCSTDGKAEELVSYLRGSGLRFVYHRNAANLRYDGNLRSAIGRSCGRYCLLMGNDDGLAGPTSLANLHRALEAYGRPAVALCNYVELSSGRVYRRITETRRQDGGPALAARLFRSYSFVSGVILDGQAARAASTTDVDGSEMYQMYLATRLVAGGGSFLGIDQVHIEKDLHVESATVDSYRQKPVDQPSRLMKRHLPMGRLLEVVGRGMASFTTKQELGRHLYRSALTLYLFTVPFWGIEYRRVQTWRYAAGILLAMSPSDLDKGGWLSLRSRFVLWLVYAATSAAALLVPIRIFDWLQPRLYQLAKRSSQ